MTGPARIFCVEDEPHILQMLQFYLEGEGFDVESCSDGNDAVARLAGDPPDLVILDVMLPYVSGVEVLEQLRAREGWTEIPVLMLTARTAEADVVRAFELGADDYLKKPFHLEELVARVNHLLRRRARGS